MIYRQEVGLQLHVFGGQEQHPRFGDKAEVVEVHLRLNTGVRSSLKKKKEQVSVE